MRDPGRISIQSTMADEKDQKHSLDVEKISSGDAEGTMTVESMSFKEQFRAMKPHKHAILAGKQPLASAL